MRFNWNPDPLFIQVCILWFWVLFNPLRLRQFCTGTWLWSPGPVASDQTKNRQLFPHRSVVTSGLSHPSARCLLHPETVKSEKGLLLLLCSHRCGIAEEFWGINSMGSRHVWSWMWFLGAKRREWRGMKTDRVKHLRVKRSMQWTALTGPNVTIQMDCSLLAAALRNERLSACQYLIF